MSDIFVPEADEDVSAQIGELMKDGNESLAWAREKALEFLDHASFLEERAHKFRRLAHDMLLEAYAFNDEIAMMIEAEFPLNIPEEASGEDECV